MEEENKTQQEQLKDLLQRFENIFESLKEDDEVEEPDEDYFYRREMTKGEFLDGLTRFIIYTEYCFGSRENEGFPEQID